MLPLSPIVNTILIAALCGSLASLLLYILFVPVAVHARILATLNNVFAAIADHFARQHTR